MQNIVEGNNGGERCLLRHRSSAVKDYVIVSNVVLIGYPQVSDGAKLTYLVIYSHDWYEPSRLGRKGYVFPTIGRLAQLRHTTSRTVQRHLAELIGAGLLTRIIRRGKPSVLYIEEPDSKQEGMFGRNRDDIYVAGVVTKMSPQQEEEMKQTKAVNGVEESVMEESSRPPQGWQPIKALLDRKLIQKKASSHVEWLAQQIMAVTDDAHSLGCYRAIAGRCSQDLVFEALALLKEARRDGSIRLSRGALFVGIVRRLCRERGLSDPLKQTDDTQPLSESRYARHELPVADRVGHVSGQPALSTRSERGTPVFRSRKDTSLVAGI
ncbi:MAG: helix-turn-helix domain-containing protein [Chloroflexi bacterium]|nr:helix-turn-helix domain-containing protein [Chloroflexota bacterium]